MKSGSNRESATAALLLGELLNKQRDFPGAERALEAAVESGQPDIVPVAAFGLGWLRSDSGDVDGALAAFNITLESGNQRFAGDAANQIGDLLRKRGDRSGARAAYEKAVAFQLDAVAAARGRVRIAQLDYEEGRHEHAMTAIKDLARSAPKAVALAASFQLGDLHAKRGEIDDARRAFNDLVQSGEPIWVDKANRELRQLKQH
jgi:tetratricopeptide (TPR) repeat protein